MDKNQKTHHTKKSKGDQTTRKQSGEESHEQEAGKTGTSRTKQGNQKR